MNKVSAKEPITFTLDDEAATAVCDLLQIECMKQHIGDIVSLPNKKEAIKRAFDVVSMACVESFMKSIKKEFPKE